MNEKKGIPKFYSVMLYGILFGLFAAISFLAVFEVADGLGISSSHFSDTETVSGQMLNQEIINAESANFQEMQTTVTDVKTAVVTDVTEVVEDKMPSIVSIINNYTYNYYYYEQDAQSAGSGIIIGSNEEELLIVTNYHVIEDNDSLEVAFCDGTVAAAQVKGTNAQMDLAVLAVFYEDLTEETKNSISIASIGDSETLKVGEPVVAIGNALGYGQSVTTGVVSALDRELAVGEISGTFIQTDAAINPGNSGGALLNIAGEVIGINSSKIGGNGVEGMGYAIPISAAYPIISDLMQQETRQIVEEDKQGYLGITGATITQTEARYYGYPEGVYVASVYENTAAEEAGIERGDFIYSFDGEPVDSMEELQRKLMYYEGGTEVEILLYRYSNRGYKSITVTVTLGSKEDMQF